MCVFPHIVVRSLEVDGQERPNAGTVVALLTFTLDILSSQQKHLRLVATLNQFISELKESCRWDVKQLQLKVRHEISVQCRSDFECVSVICSYKQSISGFIGKLMKPRIFLRYRVCLRPNSEKYHVF